MFISFVRAKPVVAAMMSSREKTQQFISPSPVKMVTTQPVLRSHDRHQTGTGQTRVEYRGQTLLSCTARHSTWRPAYGKEIGKIPELTHLCCGKSPLANCCGTFCQRRLTNRIFAPCIAFWIKRPFSFDLIQSCNPAPSRGVFLLRGQKSEALSPKAGSQACLRLVKPVCSAPFRRVPA